MPDEPTPEGKGSGAERAFSVRNWGMNTWGDLFNARQKLALITFVEKVRLVHEQMLAKGVEKEFARAVECYLTLGFDRLTTRNSNICVWHSGSEQTEKVFAVQALPMQWSYPESNPLTKEKVISNIPDQV